MFVVGEEFLLVDVFDEVVDVFFADVVFDFHGGEEGVGVFLVFEEGFEEEVVAHVDDVERINGRVVFEVGAEGVAAVGVGFDGDDHADGVSECCEVKEGGVVEVVGDVHFFYGVRDGGFGDVEYFGDGADFFSGVGAEEFEDGDFMVGEGWWGRIGVRWFSGVHG